MIEIHNFKEANQQYQSSLIPYRLFQDQAAVLLNICPDPMQSIMNAYDINHEHIDWLLKQPEASADYSTLLGGNVFVCENESDLMHIQGCDFAWAEEHGNWPNVTDMPMSWDNCSYIQESTGEPQWVIFLMCWNNAGGPSYYVPKHLWDTAKVKDHIALTEEAWK